MGDKPIVVRPLNVTLRKDSEAAKGFYRRAVMPDAGFTRTEPGAPPAGFPRALTPAPALVPKEPAMLASGLPATPEHDLEYHGGRTIQNLKYINYYVGGVGAWTS